MTIRKSAIEALDENHLWPLITHSSPSRTARVWSSVGSEPAVSGSVIETADFRSPARSGGGHGGFALGLGHREGRLQVTGQERVQPAVLLLGRSGESEDLGVAGVRRLVAEGQRRVRRGPEDLVHESELDLAVALAAEL